MTFKARLIFAYRQSRTKLFLVFAYILESLLQNARLKRADKLINFLDFFNINLAKLYKARLYFTKGDFEKALTYINAFLSKTKSIDASYFKCEILKFLGKKEEAFILIENLIKTSDRIKSWDILAKLIQDDKDFLRVEKIYKQNLNNFTKFKSHKHEIARHLSCIQIPINSEEVFKFQKNLVKVVLLSGKNQQSIKKAMSLKNALQALQDLDKLFKKHNKEYFLISGTFLGLIRDKNFISTDYDIDLGVFDIKLKDLQSMIIKDSNFILASLYHEHFVQFYHLNGIYIDIFIHYKEGDKIYHNGDFLRWKNSFFTLTDYEFLGLKAKAPLNHNLYLEENYGPNWQVPKNSLEFNSFLDTPNLEVTNEKQMIICLYYLLMSDFAKNNKKRILEKLKFYKEDEFIKECLKDENE
ncbi:MULTISPECIES: LicD family protein [unclassified Campylobacter]|uniref:LicD family protein n=1 Tax=unclassified Campylobacter TaxID=2593542 RepID=UPI00123806F0|nr:MULTISPECIES: LicD family protein [unclassified Campylobacter]KAA6224773.1 LicD family protein [Campylobacter sp. LR286c]KAA6225250.1 LicD family protein [Campylobacter sp. LR185c]KAA6233622.1 LicD family protein [Campylobacter sp. LR291e]KAA6234382.1 LicD family protein [Campylobacter sp. LR264d]